MRVYALGVSEGGRERGVGTGQDRPTGAHTVTGVRGGNVCHRDAETGSGKGSGLTRGVLSRTGRRD